MYNALFSTLGVFVLVFKQIDGYLKTFSNLILCLRRWDQKPVELMHIFISCSYILVQNIFTELSDPKPQTARVSWY